MFYLIVMTLREIVEQHEMKYEQYMQEYVSDSQYYLIRVA